MATLMNKQFLQFYLLVVLSTCVLLWSLAKLYQALTPASNGYSLSAAQLLHSEQPLLLQPVANNSLHLPAELSAKLQQGEVIALQHNTDSHYFYLQHPSQGLLQLGPVKHWQADEAPDLAWLIYSAIAMLFSAILWPLFRDIRHLSQLTLAFSRQPSPIAANIAPRSSLQPLAHNVEVMSERICRLLQQQQDVARTIAHETRTPLSRMKFTLSLSAVQLPLQYQQRLQQDIQEIEQLMTDYLDFARLEFFAPAQTTQAVQPWLDSLAACFDVYQSETTLQFHSPLSEARFIPDAMTLAVNNIISNALRYSQSQIWLQLSLNDNEYCLTVKDDGPGFTSDSSLLLQPFAHGETNAGFGLGLYIVSQVAQWHGGRLELHNQDGAVVQLYWPVTAAACAAVAD